MSRYSAAEAAAVKRLMLLAKAKASLRDLLLNAYDSSSYLCDVSAVLRYIANEPERSNLREDVYMLFGLMGRGVEPHEITGDGAINSLITLKHRQV